MNIKHGNKASEVSIGAQKYSAREKNLIARRKRNKILPGKNKIVTEKASISVLNRKVKGSNLSEEL